MPTMPFVNVNSRYSKQPFIFTPCILKEILKVTPESSRLRVSYTIGEGPSSYTEEQVINCSFSVSKDSVGHSCLIHKSGRGRDFSGIVALIDETNAGEEGNPRIYSVQDYDSFAK